MTLKGRLCELCLLIYVACQGKDKQVTLMYTKTEIVEDERAAHMSVYCECLEAKFSYFGERKNSVYLELVVDFHNRRHPAIFLFSQIYIYIHIYTYVYIYIYKLCMVLKLGCFGQ
jgi:hypothetical protein